MVSLKEVGLKVVGRSCSIASFTGIGYLFGRCFTATPKQTALIWGIMGVARSYLLMTAFDIFVDSSKQKKSTLVVLMVVTHTWTGLGVGMGMNRLGLVSGVAHTALTSLTASFCSFAISMIVGSALQPYTSPRK